MFGRLALKFYRDGYNCSQCIIKAYCELYNEPAQKRLVDMCSAIYAGFGIGSICCVYAACLMVLGLHFKDSGLNEKKALFCFGFSELFGSGNCTTLMDKYGCEAVITGSSALLEELL